MANIFLAFRGGLDHTKDKIMVFYEGLAKALARNGNNVLLWNEVHYTPNDNSNALVLSSPRYARTARDKINKFSPDAVISFNNVLPTEIESIISAPIGIYTADDVYNFFNLERLVKKDSTHNYIYFASTKYCFASYKEYCNITEDSIYYLPAATEIRPISMEQDKNISFIGTNFCAFVPPFTSFTVGEVYQACPDIVKYIHAQLKKNFLQTGEEIIADVLVQFPNTRPDLIEYIYFIFKQTLPKSSRLEYLNVLSDMGLHLYGTAIKEQTSWQELFLYNTSLALCWNPELLYSFKDNQDLYNRTKIGLNISHPQAITGFSWRVQDIMATNACLLMENKADFITLFSKYFDKSSLDAMLFTKKYELRAKAEKLLADESLRTAIVEQSQLAIEDCGRWEHRFPTLEEAFGISLFNNPDGTREGKITVLRL